MGPGKRGPVHPPACARGAAAYHHLVSDPIIQESTLSYAPTRLPYLFRIRCNAYPLRNMLRNANVNSNVNSESELMSNVAKFPRAVRPVSARLILF